MAVKMEGHTLHTISRVAVGLLSLALVYATAAPLFRGDAWWIRVFDFPRIQIATLIGLTLGCYAALHLTGPLRPWEYTLAAVIGLGLVWQFIAIAPYTVLYPNEMSASHVEDDDDRLSLPAFNVLADNREVGALRDLIRDTDPDVILLSEPNPWWLEQLGGLEDEYPYTLLQPQDNRYGMLLYSKLELVDPEIRFLVESEVPSFRTRVRLRSGRDVTFYGIHPRPPGLKRTEAESEDDHEAEEDDEDDDGEREDSDLRDAELMLIAKEVEGLGDQPVIVAGDFNDVAWSHTTHLFQRISGLLDPRVGRGLYNTFDTRSRFMRYPLDHVFASEHFLLRELRRLPHIGSDHFPMLVILDYDSGAPVVHEEPQPDAGDEQEAEEAIDKGKSKD